MMVVTDLDDLFIPLPDDLLVNLSDSRNVVDSFLDSLSTMFKENSNVESALGPALRAGFMVLVRRTFGSAFVILINVWINISDFSFGQRKMLKSSFFYRASWGGN